MGNIFESVYGSKPDVPELERTNLIENQKAAVNANLDVAKQAGQLALLTRDQIDKMIADAGGGSLMRDSADQIGKMIRGQLPLSDQQSTQLRSVAQSFGSGTAGSGQMGNLVARDLGISEVNLIGKGLSAAESWMQTAAQLYSPAMASFSSMFVTPMQMYQTTNEQNVQQFQRQWMSEQISALPDPVLSGVHGDIMGMMNSFLGGVGGGIGGGAKPA